MPTNLPPEYFDAEMRYRTASTSAEKLACIEKMLAIIPKHKGTEKFFQLCNQRKGARHDGENYHQTGGTQN